MKPIVHEKGVFPCECGKAYASAAKFSDHVHNECKAGVVPWTATPTPIARVN